VSNPTNDDVGREPNSQPPSSGWGSPPPSSGWGAPQPQPPSQSPSPDPARAQPQPPQWVPPPAQQYGAPQPGQWDQSPPLSPPAAAQPPAQSGSQWPTTQLPAQSGPQWSTSQEQQPYAGSYGAQWAGQSTGQGHSGPARKSKKMLYAILGAIVALALVGGGLFFFLSGDDITYQGRDIVEPEKVLTDAESALGGLVEERNGATNDATSCYFVVRNAETTDIEDGLVCGPVLFVDGDEGQPYLTFPLEGSAGDGDARLSVAAEPDSAEPTELANPELLRRPDGTSPPDGNGGLAVPEPPRAEEGIFTAIPSEGVELEPTPSTARIGSPTMSIDVTAIGEPERYGQGDDARRPAEGEKFVAFEIAGGLPEVGPQAEFSVTVQVDDEDAVPLPEGLDPSGGPVTVAISVPESTEDVNLVVTEGTLVQRLSVITGEPDPGNIALWQRENRSQSLTFSQGVNVRASQPGFVTEDFLATLTLSRVVLAYFSGPNFDRAPSAPGQAFLGLEADLNIDGDSGLGLDPPFWSLTLADGTVLPALDLNDNPDLIQIVFDVPASFTAGTINFGGVVTSASGFTVDSLGAVLSIPVAIPEG